MTTTNPSRSNATSNPGDAAFDQQATKHAFIEKATDDDIGRVRMMGLRFLGTNPFGSPAPPDLARLDVAIGVCLATGTILLAKLPTWKTVGMLALYTIPHPLTGERTAEEIAWWVEPEHRSDRVGVKLLGAGIEWARQVGVSCLRMNAPAGSKVGIVLERHGFRPIETAHVLRF